MKTPDVSVIQQRLIDHMNEAVWIGDNEERTIYANPKFCKLLGYTMEEMLGRPSYDFWDRESAERVRSVNKKERRKGVSSSYEGNLLTKDKRKIPVLLSGTPLPDGGTIGIMTDLTELKKKEKMERLLGHAIQSANDAIIILDERGLMRSWNKGARMMFGFKKEDVLGKSIRKTLHMEGVDATLTRTSIRYNHQLEAKHKNGQIVRLAATITPAPSDDAGKGSDMWLLIARDCTAQNKFEEELALKYQKLRDAYNKFGITRRQMDYIFDLVQICTTTHSRKQLSDFVVSAVIMLTRVDACVLRSYNPAKKSLELLSSFGLSDDWRGKAAIKFRGGLAEKAFTLRAPLKVIDLTQEPRYHSPHLAKKHNLLSMLIIPLIVEDALVGTLSLYVSPEKKLELFENEFIERYASIVALALSQTAASC